MSLFSARIIKIVRKCAKMRRTKVRKTSMILDVSSTVMGNVNLRTNLDDIARQNCSLVFWWQDSLGFVANITPLLRNVTDLIISLFIE